LEKKCFSNEILDLKKQEHRYDSIQNAIEQHQSNTRGFLISGHLDEKDFFQKWQEKVISILFKISSIKN